MDYYARSVREAEFATSLAVLATIAKCEYYLTSSYVHSIFLALVAFNSDSTSWTAPMETLRNIMGPRFSRTSQRWVPTTIGHSFESTGPITPEDDEFCTMNGLEWMKNALAEPRIAAVFTFGGNFSPNETSRCSRLYRGWGQMLIAAGPKGTSLDPMGLPPVPDATGNFVEPRCISPIRPAPSTWNWCDRTRDRSWTCDHISKTCVRSVVGTFATNESCAATCI